MILTCMPLQGYRRKQQAVYSRQEAAEYRTFVPWHVWRGGGRTSVEDIRGPIVMVIMIVMVMVIVIVILMVMGDGWMGMERVEGPGERWNGSNNLTTV
jgi:hypothetical protein